MTRPVLDTAWMTRAACRGCDPDLFFPERGEGHGREARAVCAGCPVRDECLDYAIALGERLGIWGGLGDGERRQVRKARAATTVTEAAA